MIEQSNFQGIERNTDKSQNGDSAIRAQGAALSNPAFNADFNAMKDKGNSAEQLPTLSLFGDADKGQTDKPIPQSVEAPAQPADAPANAAGANDKTNAVTDQGKTKPDMQEPVGVQNLGQTKADEVSTVLGTSPEWQTSSRLFSLTAILQKLLHCLFLREQM